MNPSNQDQPLGQPSTPEEDVALQAIESLDVEGGPSTGDATPTSPEPAPSSTSDPTPAPIISNPIEDIKAMPAADPTPSAPAVTPPIAPTPEPATASEPAPTPSAFQPFAQQKTGPSPLRVVLIIILVLVLLGAIAFFAWQYLF